jgi:hypothetical protein
MASDTSEEWSVSTDEEIYHGKFASKEEAIAEGRSLNEGPFWVGKCEEPTQPEEWWDAVDWIEHVRCQDEYSSDWADGAVPASKAQIEELEAEVRPILAAWLDRHGLRPTHFNIDPSSVEKVEPEAADQPAN